MREAFKKIPEPLQRQIIYRLLTGAAILIVSAVFLMNSMDMLSVMACVAIMGFCIISAFLLFRKAVIGDYVVISGACLSVALTAVRRRTKMITLHTEDDHILQVMIKQRLKKIRAGSQVTLYVAANVPVYEKGDGHILHSYLALESN